MVQITEFRVVMPLSLEEYRIGQTYMVLKFQEQESTGSEGVEVLINEPFDNEEFGKGQYTSKIYHMQSKAPAWVRAIAPTTALLVEEEAWNAYPKCKTILKCPYFGKCKLTLETIHVADSGQSSNVHNLTRSELRKRRVEMIDIASNVQDYWSYVIGGEFVDLAAFKSGKTGRGLLVPGWQKICNPVMTAYKLVTVDAPYWGLGYKLEQFILGGEKALFRESNKQCFGWIDDWIGLTHDDVRRMELEMDEALTMVMSQHGVLQQKANKSKVEVNGKGIASLSKAGQSSVLQSYVKKSYSQGKSDGDSKVDGSLSKSVAVMMLSLV